MRDDTDRGNADRAERESPTSGLERVAAIFGAFDVNHRELSLAGLVARCGMPRSTVYRAAERMVGLGWLDKFGARYRIGSHLFEIASLAPIRLQLREAVLPFLHDLHNATTTTVQLGVLEGDRILVVEKITGHRPMPMLSQTGGSVPVYCSALGRAILAYSDRQIVDSVLNAALPQRTPRTLTSKTAILRELAAVPSRGWAAEREEGNVGVSCIAAPIFGPLGEVVAAVSVTGPSAAVRADRIAPAVCMAAAASSRAYFAAAPRADSVLR